jgi:hypothetical protein
VNSIDHLRQASTFTMPPKKTTVPGSAQQPLNTNQETLRAARSQKRKATSPTPQEEELDQEIRYLEAIHQQVQRKTEKMFRLADLQKKIDEAAEEMCHHTQDDQDRRPQHRELRQESLFNDDEWYGDFHQGNFAFDDAYPLAKELQATPWPPSYKPPQLPMYDGHSDPKQFLMSYEATISSYGDNTTVMAKSFVMAVKSVAQTWYSSLQLGTIMSWQKLKDMLVTSFQGFQMKPVTAQALFQCTQDQEEYLHAYVQRFLRLRAQAPTVPNEIIIEAMIKGLRPGPTAQYFARKPPQTLEKLLQKMDEYIRPDNDFGQRREEAFRYSELARGFGGRFHPRHVRSIHNSSTNDNRGNHTQMQQHRSQSSGAQQSSFRPPAPRGRGGRSFGGRYGHQPRKLLCLLCGEDKGHTKRTCQVTIQKQKEITEAETQQNQPKQVLHTASYYSPYILEYVGNQQPAASVASASHSQASWAQLPPQPPLAHAWFAVNSQKGITTLSNSVTFGRSPKLAQSTALCLSRSISTKGATTIRLKNILIWCILVLSVILFSCMKNNSRRSNLQFDVILLWTHHRVWNAFP